MAYTLSAMKRQRQGQRLNARNRANASRLKTALKKIEKLAAAPDFKTASDPKKVLATAFTAIDTAARKGAIPKKRADRKKGRIAKRLHKILTGAAPAVPSA